MKISMEVLAEDLKDILCDVHIIGDSPMSLKGVRFLENTSEDFSSYVYVGQKVPPRIPESFNMICISGEQQAEFPESCSVLTVKEIDNELALFNRLLDTFQKYDEWERSCRNTRLLRRFWRKASQSLKREFALWIGIMM